MLGLPPCLGFPPPPPPPPGESQTKSSHMVLDCCDSSFSPGQKKIRQKAELCQTKPQPVISLIRGTQWILQKSPILRYCSYPLCKLQPSQLAGSVRAKQSAVQSRKAKIQWNLLSAYPLLLTQQHSRRHRYSGIHHRGATVHKYRSFVHGGNSSQARSKLTTMSDEWMYFQSINIC